MPRCRENRLTSHSNDMRWMAAAAVLAGRARPTSRPNPAVGALIVRDGRVVGRGWTKPGGRPHAEAVALEMAGDAARGAELYVTLEPCAHQSVRGPSCTALISRSGLARVIAAVEDPDPRTAGSGLAALSQAGIETQLLPHPAASASLTGYLVRQRLGRPHVTLKLATSLDGCIAMADGTSQWITGEEARAHVHLQRSMADAILVGGATLRSDAPRLDVRLSGLEARSPERWVLTRGDPPAGWNALPSPGAIHSAMPDVQYLYIEGGAETAAAFLAADLVDRIDWYRAPILIGRGKPALGDIGLASLGAAHGLWLRTDMRCLGSDTLEVYSRIPCSQE